MANLSESTILAVDDTKLNLDILVSTLGEMYDLSVALNGEMALELANREVPDLILLDIMMPGMDGYEVLRRLKASPGTADVPVIMLSALSEMGSKSRGFQLGAVDYLTKPFELEELMARVKTHLTLARTREELRQHNDLLEQKVRERTREVLLTQQATIESMAILAEFRDPETGEHIHRVKGFVALLAHEMEEHSVYRGMFDGKYIELLVQSCPLHDIGKVGVPDHILLKPGKLTGEEFEEMKLHAVYGYNAIEAVQKRLGVMPFLRIAAEIAHTHHEKWDGTGYPRGLKGEDIPLSGRIMALADVYDALISRRVYKPPFTHGQAVDIILEGRGVHFDPDVVDIFAAHSEEFRRIALDNAESEEQREALSL
jgi:putative two-component system response regulator